MSTIIEGSVPAAQFALWETAERLPETTFEAVRVVTDGAGGVMSLLWSYGGEQEVVTGALEADESIDGIRVRSRLHDATLYQLAWTTRVRVVTDLLVADRGAIVDAQCRGGTWTFRILCPERDAVAVIVEECDRYGIDLRIDRIYPMTDSSHAGRPILTDEQFETVEAALEHGYYDVPRTTTLTELSEELGVSHQALSERLRRGHQRLVETVLENRIEPGSRP